MRRLFGTEQPIADMATDNFVQLSSMVHARCGRLVDELWKGLWSVWSQTHSQFFCTNFVRSLWIKLRNSTHLSHMVYTQVFVRFSSVTGRVLPTVHTANNNYYF